MAVNQTETIVILRCLVQPDAGFHFRASFGPSVGPLIRAAQLASRNRIVGPTLLKIPDRGLHESGIALRSGNSKLNGATRHHVAPADSRYDALGRWVGRFERDPDQVLLRRLEPRIQCYRLGQVRQCLIDPAVSILRNPEERPDSCRLRK